MEPLWDKPKICEYLLISTWTFNRIAAKDKTFPARKVGGGWRCAPEQLKKWVNDQRSTPDRRNVVEVNKPRIGRPPLSGTSPKAQAR
jgi:hypothetical protein